MPMRLRPIGALRARWEWFVAVGILVGMVGALTYLLPREVFVVFVAVASMATVYYAASILIARSSHRLPNWVRTVPIWFTFLLPLSITVVLVAHYRAAVSPLLLILVIALLGIFFYYWFVVPLALYQQVEQESRPTSVAEWMGDWPRVAVLVPAYNEEGYVGWCVDALVGADYPSGKLEVVVIDDGSTDGTAEEAEAHATDVVSVVRQENGGKHSALNRGLAYTSAEVIVTVDADSVVARDSIRELVRTLLAHRDAAAVAGNVKVTNRGSLVTDLQALEYVIGINTFRRAFDLLGVVTVVPGCLGAFRRDALELVGGYDPDTLTEDFDATIQLLKRGERIHHSDAVVFTEVPDTLRDLYRQRLRWFRGNLQTIAKHRRVIVDGEFGLLHRVAFPYVLFSMSILPFLGVVVFGVLVWGFLRGAYGQLFGMFAFFSALQVLLSVLAIQIDGDDLWLARYGPLSIVGYKQFLDAVLIRSLYDVIRDRDLSWTRARRRRQHDGATDGPSSATPASED